MKVLLISPQTKRSLFCAPPLGLIYLGSTLRRNYHEVKILDLLSFRGDLTKRDIDSSDVVGLTGMSMQNNGMLEAANMVKLIDPNKPVIVGGSHASALPEIFLKEGTIDFVLRGEADEQFPLLLDVLQGKTSRQSVRGLCFKNHVSLPAIVDNVDFLPLPDWRLIDHVKYSRSHHGFFYKREPIGLIYSSRGCPYQCTFCAAHCVEGRRWRPHSPGRVLAEVENLISTIDMKELHFEDDNFTLDPQRAKTIFRLMIKEKLDLSVAFPNGIRIDTLDTELLELMKEAGVYSITVGIEFGSQRILDLAKKELALEKVEAQIKKIKDRGFHVQGFFIIGQPHEDRNDIEKTIKFALKSKLDVAFFGTYVPLPGSEDFEELVKNKKLSVDQINWDTLFSVKAHDVSYNLSVAEIEYFKSLAYKRFYLRPKTVLGILARVRSLNHLRDLLERAGFSI